VAAIADIDVDLPPIRQRRATVVIDDERREAALKSRGNTINGSPSAHLSTSHLTDQLHHHQSPDHSTLVAAGRHSHYYSRPHSNIPFRKLATPATPTPTPTPTHDGHQTRPGPRRPLHPRPRNREPKHLHAALKGAKQTPTMDAARLTAGARTFPQKYAYLEKKKKKEKRAHTYILFLSLSLSNLSAKHNQPPTNTQLTNNSSRNSSPPAKSAKSSAWAT
jgi:hypothetical protein